MIWSTPETRTVPTSIMDRLVRDSLSAGLATFRVRNRDVGAEGCVRHSRTGIPVPSWVSTDRVPMVGGSEYRSITDIELSRSVESVARNRGRRARSPPAFRVERQPRRSHETRSKAVQRIRNRVRRRRRAVVRPASLADPERNEGFVR